MATDLPQTAKPARPSLIKRIRNSDLYWSFSHSRSAKISALILAILILAAIFAPLIAPQNPYDGASLDMWKAELPPVWQEGGEWPYLLGTDTQGRDMLSAILYGTRISIVIGVASVALSLVIGMTAGLVAGYFGGFSDNLLMRIGDITLSIPTILVAILVSTVVRQMLPDSLREVGASAVLILAIALSAWVQYARTVRAQAIVETGKDYVQAAKLIGVPARRIMANHILPNTLTPIMVAATLNFGMAILTEATLSFLGIGMPPSQPSLGTLIRIGNQFLFSGSWWIVLFPVFQLCLLVVTVNLLGDWLRDALNPKLR
ncbi:ABC transporter permease [Rhizobium oryzihabitans]|jgi:peptide/nickel transport system permease protein|uniref:ABC transporter permease n=2 Tax=Rhizobium/Agrobacterium group TaxID=227290 RepID=A0A7L5BQB4_9HYPH|nr:MULTISPECIES: ABC transporter permease [Rhizobium/Agrobacterium group]CUX45341.1 putative oligopeptide ABC transporter (permease protein) [Agrobacterium genomosp. 5 str. CFBP 6626]HCD83965.1 ABC transporter permease [Agrobacterium sp.]QCM08138.1 ABC transporter permease [Agrobacterium tumefaciens]QIB41100.1 ABC transporter permease [Rhizobium oryzihabitans]TQN57338.1 ABC transporter permease [Agrobacterium tumefaciens]